MSAPAPRRPSRPRWLAPGLVLLAIGWAALVHYGLGPRPDLGLRWWSPRGFLTRALLASPWEWLIGDQRTGLIAFGTPALLLAAGCWLTTRSALLRAVAVTSALACWIFLIYALGSGITQVTWNLFHWRASGTMLAIAAVVGCTLVSPWLARRWLELGWPARLAWFLPVALLVIALERNVTGTNPRLPFAISPWPVVQVFGLETVGTIVAALLGGLALGLFGLARVRAGGILLGGALLALGLALPAAWLALGSQGFLPFRAEARSFAAATALCAFALAATALPRLDAARVRRRARTAGTAALLLGLPLFVGQAWARLDYTRNRDVQAQRIIDGLEKYYARESIYPETLTALVEAADLDAVPQPRVGFRFLDDSTRFTYQAFGTSYLLEFPAPRWVQCAYNPPYQDEDEEAGEDGTPAAPSDTAADEEVAEGAWSCPSSPPELW